MPRGNGSVVFCGLAGHHHCTRTDAAVSLQDGREQVNREGAGVVAAACIGIIHTTGRPE